MLKRILFVSSIGDLLLSWFEALTGLAIVNVNELTLQRPGKTTDSAPAELAEA